MKTNSQIHHSKFAFYLSAVIFLTPITLRAQSWVPFGSSIYPGQIAAIEYDHNAGKLYVGTTSKGIYVSLNNGDAWSPMNNGLPSAKDVSDLALNSSGTLYAVVNGVVYSNSGSTWSEMANSSVYIANAFLVKTDINNKVFAFTKSGVYTPSTSGTQWDPVTSGLGTMSGIAKVTRGLDNNLYVAWAGGVAKWNNTNWSQLGTSGLLVNSFVQAVRVASADANGIVYAGGDNGFLKYNTATSSWSHVDTGIPVASYGGFNAPIRVLDIMVNSSGDFFLVTQDITTSTWAGNVYYQHGTSGSWSQLSGGLPANILAYRLLLQGNAHIFAAGSEGLYRSSDNGASWVSKNNGIDAPIGIKSFDFLPTGAIVIATANRGKIFKGDNAGSNWNDITGNLASPYPGTLKTDNQSNIFLAAGAAPAGQSSPSSGIFYTQNIGTTWARAFPDDRAAAKMQGVTVLANSDIYCGGAFDPAPHGSSIHYSTDHGNTWTIINLSGLGAGQIICSTKNSNGYIFAGSETGGVFRSIDNGTSFQAVSGTSGLGGNVQRIDIAPWGDIFISFDYTRGMYYIPASSANSSSANAAAIQLSNFPSLTNPSDVAFGGTGTLYVATDKGLYVSTDNGQSWVAQNSGLNFTKISRIKYNALDGYLYLSNQEGLFRSSSPIASVTVPIINKSVSSLPTFSTTPGSPSSPQQIIVSGNNLTGNVTISAPSNFEVSLNSTGGYNSTAILIPSSGSVANTTIYVRYNPSVSGTHSGNVTMTSAGAASQTVSVSGSATSSPIINVSASFSAFTTTPGSPSSPQQMTVSGSSLADDIIITSSANFEISLNSGSGYANAITLTQNSGIVSNTVIYVWYHPSAAASDNGTITIKTSGIADQSINVSGNASITTSIEDNVKEKHFSIYPNPSNGKISIDVEGDFKIFILNAMGQKVYESVENSFLINHLPPGYYFVKVKKGNRDVVQKLVLNK